MKKKVLIISKYFFPYRGGVETFINNLIEYLDAYDVTLFCYNHGSDIINPLNEKVKIIRVNPFIIFKGQPISFDYRILKRLIKNNDVIIHNYPQPIVELSLMLMPLKNKNLITVWHANIENSRWSYFNFILNKIAISVLKLSSKVVISNEALFNNNKNSNFFKDYKVIPLEGNCPLSDPLTRGFPDKVNVLYLGALRKYKGLNYLIDVAKLDFENKYKIIIAGEGEEYQILSEQITAEKLSDKVKLVGGVSDQEKVELFRNSHVFVLPSINEAEAYGIVQVEAMTYSLPIINTKLNSGVPHLGDDNCSITVSTKNSIEIFDALNKIFYDEKTYLNYCKSSYNRSKYYSRDKIKLMWNDILEKK